MSKVVPAITKGLYTHIKTDKLYNVLSVGRLTNKPEQQVVIYAQMYESKLKGTDISLPISSIWVRNIEEFNDGRFEKLK